MVRIFPWSWLLLCCFSLLFSCANDIANHGDADEDVVDCIADRD